MFYKFLQFKNKLKTLIDWFKIYLNIEYDQKISSQHNTFEFISTKKVLTNTNKKFFLKTKNSWITLFPDANCIIKKPKFIYKNKNNKFFMTEKNSSYSINDLIKQKKISGSILANIKNAKIINNTLLVMVEKNLALIEGYGDFNWAKFKFNKWPDSHHYPNAKIKYFKKPIINKRIKLYLESKKIKKIQKGIYFSTRNDDQVYHWIFDNLTRLYCLDKITKLKSYPLIVKNKLSRFQIETLKLLGVKNKIIYEPNKDIEVDNLIFPSIPSPPILNINSLNWLRNKFLTNINKKFLDKNYHFYDKIFISRKDTNHRNIINEEDLSFELEKRGYKTLELSKLDIANQILIFNKAKKIIIPHGASGIHLLFIKKKTDIIEIQSPEQLNNSLYMISTNLGGNHKIAIGTNSLDKKSYNYYVDVKKIIKNID